MPPSLACSWPKLVSITQNWAYFMTLFDPDNGSGNGQKMAFAQWVNGTNKRFGYICRDTDLTPSLSNSAPTSMGALLATSNLSGTHLVWEACALRYRLVRTVDCGLHGLSAPSTVA